MTHERDEIEPGSALRDDEAELDTATPLPILVADHLTAAVRRAAAERRRLVVRDADVEIAAISPVIDVRLHPRLEEEELDRIDWREAQRALADPDNYRVRFSVHPSGALWAMPSGPQLGGGGPDRWTFKPRRPCSAGSPMVSTP